MDVCRCRQARVVLWPSCEQVRTQLLPPVQLGDVPPLAGVVPTQTFVLGFFILWMYIDLRFLIDLFMLTMVSNPTKRVCLPLILPDLDSGGPGHQTTTFFQQCVHVLELNVQPFHCRTTTGELD